MPLFYRRFIQFSAFKIASNYPLFLLFGLLGLGAAITTNLELTKNIALVVVMLCILSLGDIVVSGKMALLGRQIGKVLHAITELAKTNPQEALKQLKEFGDMLNKKHPGNAPSLKVMEQAILEVIAMGEATKNMKL